MNAEITHSGQVSVINLPPRLLLADAPALRLQLTSLVEAGHHHLVIDLARVQMMDSSGLSVLVSAFKAVRGTPGRVVLARPSLDIESLIELTQMNQLFPIFSELDAAVTALQ